ncbi:2,4-dienoyl-CoA reductase-like NADH-dependent reductase (Old Yellow Enzyme family) [Azospirillum agricola]|nr:hypothetical protein [Azospirillum agricola]MBP2231674.1 2,4-dienoyl-CoA reductase-like NADH-dependent reductase (Old Yellow Enzyme family) [Azospirillum agricola]
MTRQDIADCVEAWGGAAARADRAGYDFLRRREGTAGTGIAG